MARTKDLFTIMNSGSGGTVLYNNGHKLTGNGAGSNGWYMYQMFNTSTTGWGPDLPIELTIDFSKPMRITKMNMHITSTSGTQVATTFNVKGYDSTGALVFNKTVASTTLSSFDTNFSNTSIISKMVITFSVRMYIKWFQLSELVSPLALISAKDGVYTVDDSLSLVSTDYKKDELTTTNFFDKGYNPDDLKSSSVKVTEAIKKIDDKFSIHVLK